MKVTQSTLLAAIISIAATPFAGAGTVLAPHRAVYDINLKDATDRSGITGVEGRMVYEFNGSPCEGYTVNFRFVTQIDTDEATRLTDQQTTTYEDASGGTFSFATKSFVDSRLDREVRGTAVVNNSKTTVELVKPDEGVIELQKTMFPTRHMVDLLERAADGQTFYESTIFDGSDSADQVMTTTVIVGKQGSAAADDPESGALSGLKGSRFWPVSISYFEPPSERGEELPVYRIAFKLYPNGVTRSIIMDYGDFSMSGKLVDLDIFEQQNDCR